MTGSEVAYALGNLVLWALMLNWFWRRTGQAAAPTLRRWFWPALGLRMAGGVALGLFYQHQLPTGPQPGGDTFATFRLSAGLTGWLGREPAAAGRVLVTGVPPPPVALPGVFRPTARWPFAPYLSAYFIPSSNSWFFARLLAWLNLLTGSSYWLAALWLSTGAFAGGWLLVRELTRLVPGTAAGALAGTLLWPSLVFWGAGVSKDGVLLAVLGAFTAAALRLTLPGHATGAPASFGAVRSGWRWWTLLAGSAWLFWRIKFFIAAVAFVAFGALFLTLRLRARWPRLRPAWLLAGLLLALAPGSRLLHRAFRPEYARYQIAHNQQVLAATIPAGQPRLAFPLTPSLSSFVRYAPAAAVGVFVRPWVWEGEGLRWRVAGLENAALLLLAAAALRGWWRRGQPRQLPLLAGALLFFLLIVALMLGLTTPNFGSLHRYRIVLLPFTGWLLDWLRVGGALSSRLPPLGSPVRSSPPSGSLAG